MLCWNMEKLKLHAMILEVIMIRCAPLFASLIFSFLVLAGSSAKQINNRPVYSFLKEAIQETKATHLKECNCMKAFYRDLLGNTDESSRYVLDKKVAEHGLLLAKEKKIVDVLFFGSGKLLNELTVVANILASGKSAHVYITDWAYTFWDEKDFPKLLEMMEKNPDKRPENWKNFNFWDPKNLLVPVKDFLTEHHQAIAEFRILLHKLDENYGTHSNLTVLKTPSEGRQQIPLVDLFVSIDSFLDLPNFIWQMQYGLELHKPNVRFITLNKHKPNGYFWDWDLKEFENARKVSKENVQLEIYDFQIEKNSKKFTMLESLSFSPTKPQLKCGPVYSEKKLDMTQSAFEEHVCL